MFNEIHEMQELRYELDKLTAKLQKEAYKEHDDRMYSLLNDASDLLDELGDMYGECIDIIEEG